MSVWHISLQLKGVISIDSTQLIFVRSVQTQIGIWVKDVVTMMPKWFGLSYKECHVVSLRVNLIHEYLENIKKKKKGRFVVQSNVETGVQRGQKGK